MNESNQLCLFCRGYGFIVKENVGLLTTTVDCPAGCPDRMFDVNYPPDDLDDIMALNQFTPEDDPC